MSNTTIYIIFSRVGTRKTGFSRSENAARHFTTATVRDTLIPYLSTENPMIFESIMLVCFGLAWPFSIYKSWKSRQVGSKSFIFLLALLVGYVAGIIHKLFYAFDWVVYLYVLNGVMVAIDMSLYLRNRLYQIRESAAAATRGENR